MDTVALERRERRITMSVKQIDYTDKDKAIIKKSIGEIYHELSAVAEIAEEYKDKALLRKLKKFDDSLTEVMEILEEHRDIFPEYLNVF